LRHSISLSFLRNSLLNLSRRSNGNGFWLSVLILNNHNGNWITKLVSTQSYQVSVCISSDAYEIALSIFGGLNSFSVLGEDLLLAVGKDFKLWLLLVYEDRVTLWISAN